MDENNEKLNPENEVAESVTDADTQNTENAEAEQTVEASQEADASEPVAEAAEETMAEAEETADAIPEAAVKKGKTLQRTIIISAAIVVCALLIAIVCRLFFSNGVVNTNLFGAKAETCWHYSTPVQTSYTATADEVQTADYYFLFEPDNTLKIKIGSFEYSGSYSVQYMTDENTADAEQIGKPVLNIENTNSIDGMYFYEVTGNAFTGKTMKLTSVSSDTFTFEFDSKSYEPAKIEREGEFEGDDKITGSWTNKNEYASQTLTFNGDGTYSISTKTSTSKQVENGLYSCKDGSVSLYSFYITTQSQSFKYTTGDEKLTIIQELVMPSEDGTTPVTIEQPIEYTKD